MKITVLFIGKTDQEYLREGIQEFVKRLKRHADVQVMEAPVQKKWNSLPEKARKDMEADIVIKQHDKHDVCVLLDERGKQFTSAGFATFLAELMNRSTRTVMFVVGGPYGFSEKLEKIPHQKLSLSRMTFSHQMVRLFLAEQLYRAFSIIKGEPYHHG